MALDMSMVRDLLLRARTSLRHLHPLFKSLIALSLFVVVVQLADKSPRDYAYFYMDRVIDRSTYFAEDPELFWQPADRFRPIDELAAKTRPQDRLLFFGDSVTYGHGYATVSYPEFLQRRLSLDERHSSLRVLNYAFLAYSSQQAKALAARVLAKYDGRLIFLSVGANEIGLANYADQVVYRMNQGWAKKLLFHLNGIRAFSIYRRFLVSLKREMVTRNARHAPELVARVSPAEFRKNALDFMALARDKRMKLVLMSEENRMPANRAELEPYYRIMAQLAEQNPQVIFIDVRPFLRQFAQGSPADYTYTFETGKNIFVDTHHLSDDGNRLVGNFIYEEMLRRGLFD